MNLAVRQERGWVRSTSRSRFGVRASQRYCCDWLSAQSRSTDNLWMHRAQLRVWKFPSLLRAPSGRITAMIPLRRQPGPAGHWLSGNLGDFGRDPLGFLGLCAANYGDVVRLRFFNRSVCLVNNPAVIEHVLATGARKFRKTMGYRTPFMRRLFGNGLLTSEGEHWTKQRRLAQPAFHRDRINAYARQVVEFTDEMVSGWRSGETMEIHAEVLKLTTRVVVKSLFNSEVPPEIDNLSESSAVVMKRFSSLMSPSRMWMNLLPSRSGRAFGRVMKQLDEFIFRLVRERRASGEDKGDLLSMLLMAGDEDGSGMSDQELRDELVTLMVAGLDTTALALSWAIHLLAHHPEVQSKLKTELSEVAGSRCPTVDELKRLPFTEAVIKESLRLYPPAWIVGREALEDFEAGGVLIPEGTSVIMSQWLVHRDARWFPDADAFRPERWLDGSTAGMPKFAYFPFGGGPRICIGSAFAMMEATLALAVIQQRFAFTDVPGKQIGLWPAITLQPSTGIWVRLRSVANAPGETPSSALRDRACAQSVGDANQPSRPVENAPC